MESIGGRLPRTKAKYGRSEIKLFKLSEKSFSILINVIAIAYANI